MVDILYCTVEDAYRQAFPGTDLSSIPTGLPTVEETQDHIRDAMAEIDQECQTAFVPTTETEYHDGNNTSILYPRKYPIISVSSLKIDDVSQTEDTDFIVRGSVREGARIEIMQGAGIWFTVGQKNIELTYTYGYSSIPRLARAATAQLAAIKMLIAQTGGTYNDITGFQIGTIQGTYGEPAANINKTFQYLAGLADKPGKFEETLSRLKKYVGYRVISYYPSWGWIK